MKRTTVAPNPL